MEFTALAMAWSRRTIRPSPARRIFSNIDTGQRSLTAACDWSGPPGIAARARLVAAPIVGARRREPPPASGHSCRSTRSGRHFPLPANGNPAPAWAFEQGYGRLELRAEPENAPSQRVAIAAGYAREGILRGGALRRDGSRVDVTLWARLAADPPGPSLRLLPDLPGGELSDSTVTLRPLHAEDVEALYELHELPEVVAAQVPPEQVSRERLARWCARAENDWLAGTRAALTVRDAVTDVLAGEIGLFYREPNTGQAMIGYDLVPAWRGRGYASRAVRLLAAWAFERTGIVRLIAGTAPENVASQRVLESTGFRREGYQRSRLPGLAGPRIDDLLYALLPDELRLTPTRTPSR